MKEKSIEASVKKTSEFVRKSLANAEGGHDWWHVYRVWNLAKYIAHGEVAANRLVVELGALLHDIADAKFYAGDETVAPYRARKFLQILDMDADVIDHVEKIIMHISFKGGHEEQKFKSLELDIVQDADRLDAMGAIGIARTFNYGGYKGRELYNPQIEPNLNMSKEEYRNSNAPTINHFYEKLLLLKDRMNTPTGKKIALHRHAVMENFLREFYAEWNCDM